MLSRRVLQSLAVFLLAMGAWGAPLASRSETWIELRSPNFIVLTNANEKQARRVAYQFEMIRGVFRELPNVRDSAKDPTVTIIAAKNEDTLKALLPDYWAKEGLAHPTGFYVGGPEKNYMALRLDVSMSREAYEPFEPIYHEYVHFLTRRSMAQLPLWMVEGLAEYYGNTRIEGKRVLVGVPSTSNLIVLHQNRPLRVSTLFGVTASSPYYHEENKASIFYAESWALTHYLITRDLRENTRHVSDFVALLGQNVAPEEAARRTIGEPEVIDRELSRYIDLFSFTDWRLNAPPGIDESDFEAQPISEAQSLAVRADFMAHDRHYAEAQEMLADALKLDPKLAAAYESMGFIYTQQGKLEEGNKWFSQAVALNSQSYLVNYYYAMNFLKGAADDVSAAKGLSGLRTAIKISPDFAPALDALAWLLASRHENLDEAYRLGLRAVSLEPGNVQYRLTGAFIQERMGHVDNAVRIAEIAVSMAKTPDEQAQAMAVLTNAQQYRALVEDVKGRQEALGKAQADAAAGEIRQSDGAGKPEARGESSGAGPLSASLSSSRGRSDGGQDSAKPPPLRHRDQPAADDARMPQPGRVLIYHPPRPEVLPRRQVVEGTIKDAKCSGTTTLELALESPHGVMQLYSDDYLKVSYLAMNFTPTGILNPCTGIKGWLARITYHPVKGEGKQGQMVKVELMKD